jgi:hypothetical protein
VFGVDPSETASQYNKWELGHVAAGSINLRHVMREGIEGANVNK